MAAYKLYIAARAICIAPDLLVVVFTWMKTRPLIASAQAAGFRAILPKVLMSSGMIYKVVGQQRLTVSLGIYYFA